jgi:hypothetical protein
MTGLFVDVPYTSQVTTTLWKNSINAQGKEVMRWMLMEHETDALAKAI